MFYVDKSYKKPYKSVCSQVNSYHAFKKEFYIFWILALVVGVSTFARATNNSLLSTELVNFLVVSMLTSFTASAIERPILYPWSYNVSQQHVYFLFDDRPQVFD